MKKIWNGFKIAFSMYSKIPMPKSDWSKENMRCCMCAFPLVGLPIGVCTVLWRKLAGCLGLSGSAFSAVALMVIPVMITGGIHLDGLLDTEDALSSYREKEERLEILKDSRTGAFAVIKAVIYFFFYFGIYSFLDLQIGDEGDKAWRVIALSFLVSRALSGYGVVSFPKAKDTGLAASFSKEADKKAVQISMGGYLAAAAILMSLISPVYTLAVYIFAFGTFVHYYFMAEKKFGGITGDLAGWFLQRCELAMAFSVMLVTVLGGVIWY